MNRVILVAESRSKPKIVASSARCLENNLHLCGHAPDVIRSAEGLVTAFSHGDRYLAVEKLKECRGNFWGWFEDQNRLWVFNDRWGSYPIFRGFAKTGDEIIFGNFSEVLPLLELSIDPRLLVTYLTFGYLPGDDSFFAKIHAIPPGSLIEFSRGGERLSRYFSFLTSGRLDISPQESRKELRWRLLSAVANSIEGFDEINISLSSGVDSRGLLIAALECLPANRIHAFTYGLPGTFDYELSKKVARQAGVDLKQHPISIEGYGINEVMDLAKDCGNQIFFLPQPPLKSFELESLEGMPVLIGFAGGPVTGSHVWSTFVQGNGRNGWQNRVFDRHAWLPPDLALSCLIDPPYTADDFRSLLLERYFTDPEGSENWDMVALADYWDFYHRQRKYNLFCTSKVRHRQTYIYPFLDPRLAEFLWALPVQDRLNRSAYLDVLKELSPRLFEIPTSRSFGGPVNGKPLTRPVKAVNALRFWLEHNLFSGNFHFHINQNYLPFYLYYNESWEVISYLRAHQPQLKLLNWRQFEVDLETLDKIPSALKSRRPEMKRINAMINLGFSLLLAKKSSVTVE